MAGWTPRGRTPGSSDAISTPAGAVHGVPSAVLYVMVGNVAIVGTENYQATRVEYD